MVEERRVNLSGELQSLRDAVADLAVAVSTAFDEERLKEALLQEQKFQNEQFLRDQRRERNRLVSFIVLGVVLLAAIGILGGLQSRANHNVADEIHECQKPGTPCSDRAQQQFATAIRAEYAAIVCYVAHPIPDRNQKLADDCINTALANVGVSPTGGVK
jgi:hypothetical protein